VTSIMPVIVACLQRLAALMMPQLSFHACSIAEPECACHNPAIGLCARMGE